MKVALTLTLAALLVFSSMAQGQVVEETFLAKTPSHLRLLPQYFLKPQPNKPSINDWLKPRTINFPVNNWSTNLGRTEDKASGYLTPLASSPSLAKIQLEAMSHQYIRLGKGNSIPKRLIYSFKEELKEEAIIKNASISYRPYELGTSSMGGPLSKYHHDRQTDPKLVISRQLFNTARKGVSRELGPDVLDLIKHMIFHKR